MAAKKDDKPKVERPTVVCPTCGGRKTVSFSTADFRCATCRGKGTVRA